MALKLRPTGLGSGIDKDRPDYTPSTVADGMLAAYTKRAADPDSLRWFRSMTVNGPTISFKRITGLLNWRMPMAQDRSDTNAVDKVQCLCRAI